MGAGTIELDGDFKAEQMEVNVGAGTIENSGSLDIKEADFTVGVGTADISELQVENLKEAVVWEIWSLHLQEKLLSIIMS